MANFSGRFTDALSTLCISDGDKKIVTSRFLPLVISEERSYNGYYWVDVLLSFVITVGAILGASFIALTDAVAYGANVAAGFKWTCWAISLAIAIAGKCQLQFNTAKKRALGSIMIEKLHAEGWAFIAGSGRYDGLSGEIRVKTFMTRIEKLKAKSIESQPDVSMDNSLKELLAGASISGKTVVLPTGNVIPADSVTATKATDSLIEAAIMARKNLGISDSESGAEIVEKARRAMKLDSGSGATTIDISAATDNIVDVEKK